MKPKDPGVPLLSNETKKYDTLVMYEKKRLGEYALDIHCSIV